MTKPHLLAAAAMIATATLACDLTSLPGGGSPEQLATDVAASVSATLAAALPTAAAAPPTAASTPAVPALPARLWMSYSGGGTEAWWLDGESATKVTLPITIGQYYDFSATTSRILYASHFSSEGAGPAHLAVSDLWMADYPSGAAQAILPADTVVEALWAPDGQALAYILATPERYELHWRTLAGDDRLLATDLAPTWSVSPSGDRVAFTRESGYESVGPPGLYVVPAAGGAEVKLSDVDRHGSGGIGDRPDWSLDGSHVALSYSDPSNGHLGLIVAAADGSATADLTFGPSVAPEIVSGGMPASVLWHPDLRHLVALGGNYYGMGGPQDVVLFELDPALTTIVGGAAFGVSLGVVDWAVPGTSIFHLDDSGGLAPLALP
jgi:hypothetical protein